jgi:hypothetical protein
VAEQRKNLVFREFGALDTQSPRNVIGDKEFYWIQEWMPTGSGNLKMVPGASAALATITVTGQSIYYWMSATINASNYVYCFLTDGSAYEVNTDTAAILSGVVITGTGGQFSCAASSLAVGQAITISGTLGGTGSITGYANPTTCYIIATNGSTTFTLSATLGGTAITTMAGTPTGLAYGLGVVRFAAAGKFSGLGTRASQWKNERILIADPGNGYFDYDRTTLTSYKGTIYNAAITIAGGGFTTAPVIVPSYGTATFSSTVGAQAVQVISAAGTGYQVGDILTVSDGTFTQAAQIKVTGINAGTGAITGAVMYLPGFYTSAPANPVSVTGGYGSSATFTLGFALESVTVTNPGSGEYATAPTLIINPSGASGSSITISTIGNYTIAPTSPVSVTGGTGAAFTANIVYGIISASGVWTTTNYLAGYQIGDVLTLTAGTFSTAATVIITNISGPFFGGGGLVFYFYYSVLTNGVYSVFSGSSGTSGGHGSGLVVSAAVMGAVSATVAAAGAGYTNNDVLTVSGGTFSTFGTATKLTYKTGGASGGAAVVANLNLSISGTAIATYSGHVWIVTNSRTVVFSAPSSYQDFLTADAAGSFILTDETMRSSITALKAANDYIYIAGVTSMFVVSNVTTTAPSGGNPTTTFSLNNLSTSFGTDLPDSILPHYRSLLYGSDYGWYMLTGVTPQKISDPLDGFLSNANFSKATAGQCIIYGKLCECWLVQYTDPASHAASAILMVYFDNKWFLSVQNSALTLIVGGVSNDSPALFGTDGSNIYRLFSDTATQRAFKIQTKLWDMGNPLMTKQTTRVGIDTTIQNSTTFNISSDTEKGSTVTPLVLSAPGYYFAIANTGSAGNYVGLTITGTATPGDLITGIFMEYEPQTPWAYSHK